MPKILKSKRGYWQIDSWSDVLMLQHVTSWLEIELYQGLGPASFVSLRSVLEEAQPQIPEGFSFLGNEDGDYEIGFVQKLYWARDGSYRYVGKEKLSQGGNE